MQRNSVKRLKGDANQGRLVMQQEQTVETLLLKAESQELPKFNQLDTILAMLVVMTHDERRDGLSDRLHCQVLRLESEPGKMALLHDMRVGGLMHPLGPNEHQHVGYPTCGCGAACTCS
jgi:hypothetical protein